jgi:hypothetical protein
MASSLIAVTRAQMIDWLQWHVEACAFYASIYTRGKRSEADLSDKVLEGKRQNEHTQYMYSRCLAVLQGYMDADEYDDIWLEYVLGHTAATLKYGHGRHAVGDAVKMRVTKLRNARIAAYKQAQAAA